MTYSDGIIDIVNSSASNFIDGLLKIVQTTKCLFIAEEGKYYANPVCIFGEGYEGRIATGSYKCICISTCGWFNASTRIDVEINMVVVMVSIRNPA